jgi:type VI secretion system FHA domain protein
MFLILQVTSANAAMLGTASRAVFTAAGGSIGRRAGNDWVLPDGHVSGRHAGVRAIGGTFFLEDNESANGVIVNGNRLHAGEPFPLKDGDKIFIDPFEISVSVSMTRPGAAVEPLDAPAPAGTALPPMHLPPIASLPESFAPAGGGGLLDDFVAEPSGFGDLIPEAGGALPSDFNPLLDEPVQSQAPSYSGASLQSKPVLHDVLSIQPLVVTPTPPAQGGPGAAIPTDWDDLTSTASVGSPPQVPPPPVMPPLTPQTAPHIAPPVPPPVLQPIHQAVPQAVPPPVARPVAAAPPMAPPAVPPIPANARPGDDFANLLRGAGVPGENLAPEVMAEFGLVLRSVIEGLMEVLRARGEIRNEFRLPQTTFKPRDNNPLKLAVNAEDAIHNLLVKRNPAYLGTTAAFDDAFKDVRHHQLAMLAGMRAAYGFMLQRFDPQALKAQFDAKPGRKGFGFGGQGRYWESFEEFYREVTADSDDCFRRLFGDQFARAYEEQIQLLRAARDRTKNQT